jgi:prepilin-type N-terminal cleavage/methylation domain-containing protein
VRRAFALIEVLVVLAVIAVLAALLFPVFTRARAAAGDSVSLQSLKQLGTAVHLYAADNGDQTPWTVDAGLKAGLLAGDINADVLGRTAALPTIVDALEPYKAIRSLWVSPSDPGEFSTPAPFHEIGGSSYQYLVNLPCSGALSGLSEPAESAILRDAAPFRRNQAHTLHSDTSAKLLAWPEASRRMGLTEDAWQCPAQSAAAR